MNQASSSVPFNVEPTRVATLRRLGLLDGAIEPAFDRLTSLASRFLKVPVSLVSFADEDRIFFKSCHGMPEGWAPDRTTPRSHSLCSHVMTSPAPLVINDTRTNDLVKNMTAVTEFGVAAYLGVPLLTADGSILGSLCALDTVPRAWTTAEVATLQDLAASVMAEINLRVEIIERTRIEAREAELRATEAAATQRANKILDSITDAFFTLDADWQFTYLNPRAEVLLSRSRGDLLGRVIWDEFPAAVGSPFERMYRLAREERRAVNFEEFFPPLRTWFEVHAYPADGGLAVYFRDINAKRHAEKLIRETQEQLQILLDGARDHALILMSTEGVILDWQGGAERIIGWTKEEVIGRNGSIIFTPEDRAAGIDVQEFVKATEFGQAPDVRWHLKKDGSRFFSDGVMTRLDDEHGQLRGFAKVFQDATARKRAEETLHLQSEALKEADLRKNEFLAMLAHELRNPLAAIRNALSVAQAGGEADFDWSLDVIHRQLRSFTHLIDDLLDVARITQGKVQLRKSAVDLNAVIRHAVEAVNPLIELKKHQLTLTLPAVGPPLEADPIRLEQILVNILTNAAKYTPPDGQIEVTVQVEDADIVIRVTDDGVGIAPDQLPRMFELFAQADRSLARAEGGLGIGLTLVKSLVEMHGGTVAAASEGRGRGSQFTIRLPVAAAGTVAPLAPRPPRGQPGSSLGRKVLVVDDNGDTARGMARLLKLAGHEVRVAHDGWSAIEQAREFCPVVVLLDIGLPGLDGYEVAQRLRQEDCCRDALLIAASGYNEDQARDRSHQAGFNHHLTKPVDFDTITALLDQFAASSG